MLRAKLALIVNTCTRHAWIVVAIAALVTVLSGLYVAKNFAINTDINKLLSSDPPWRQRELEYSKVFPESMGSILVVVDAPTSELATQASAALAQKLSQQPDLFPSVEQKGASSFFLRNGLLFLPTDEVARNTGALARAQPLLQVLVADQSLRGLVQALSF